MVTVFNPGICSRKTLCLVIFGGMKRKLEPELMLNKNQALAYAQANFEDSHTQFVPLFQKTLRNPQVNGHVLDLGCGTCDISIRFATAYPTCEVHGLDGSPAMLELGRQKVAARQLKDRVIFIEGRIPMVQLSQANYDAVISNSLLHHVPEIDSIWKFIARWAKHGAPIFMMDLVRPSCEEEVRNLVDLHAAGESPILRKDFSNSLRAAYRPEEIEEKLQQLDWRGFRVRQIDRRHLIVFGFCP